MLNREVFEATLPLNELQHDFAVPRPIRMLGSRAVDAKRLALWGLHRGQDLGHYHFFVRMWRLRHVAAMLMGGKQGGGGAHMSTICEEVEDL